MNFNKEIESYIDNKNAVGALLVDGKWGAGKTWSINKLKKRHSTFIGLKFWNWRRFRFVSLFGIKDVTQFKDAVKRKHSPFWHNINKIIGFIGIAALLGLAPKLGELIGKWPNAHWSGEARLYELFGIKGNIVVSSVAILLFGFFYLFINRKIRKRKFIRKNIIVFDDFERCELPMITLLGLINELVEDKIKVIIIANEEKIAKKRISEYKEFKEKVVMLKLNYSSGIEKNFNEIIKRFGKAEYNNFLTTHKESITDSFNQCANENIRALINGLSMFESIFEKLKRKSFEHTNRVLINFLEVYYMNCQGHDVNPNYEDMPYGGILEKYKEKSTESKIYHLRSNNFFVPSLAAWIKTGVFDENMFNEEIDRITKQQKPKEQSAVPDEEKILKGWGIEFIEDDKLDDTYNKALEIAYNGDTNFDGYISLMSADARLKVLEITHCPINWNKFENGLSKYIESIETSEEFEHSEVEHHRFITIEDLEKYFDNDARRIYQKIEKYNPAARKNRAEFLKALNSKDISAIGSTSYRKIFDTFDKEMCDAFIEIYSGAIMPNEKRELLNIWREMSGSLALYAKTSPEIYDAVKRFKDGISKVKTLENSISQKINNEFISDIEKFLQDQRSANNEV